MDFYDQEHLVDEGAAVRRLSVYGVHLTKDKVLLIQDPRSLRWELPGGGRDPGETLRRALAREMMEETGLTLHGRPKLLTQWIELYYDIPTQQAWRTERKFYLVPAVSGELLVDGNGDDSAMARLIPLNTMSSLKIAPRIREVIELTCYEREC